MIYPESMVYNCNISSNLYLYIPITGSPFSITNRALLNSSPAFRSHFSLIVPTHSSFKFLTFFSSYILTPDPHPLLFHFTVSLPSPSTSRFQYRSFLILILSFKFSFNLSLCSRSKNFPIHSSSPILFNALITSILALSYFWYFLVLLWGKFLRTSPAFFLETFSSHL